MLIFLFQRSTSSIHMMEDKEIMSRNIKNVLPIYFFIDHKALLRTTLGFFSLWMNNSWTIELLELTWNWALFFKAAWNESETVSGATRTSSRSACNWQLAHLRPSHFRGSVNENDLLTKISLSLSNEPQCPLVTHKAERVVLRKPWKHRGARCVIYML